MQTSKILISSFKKHVQDPRRQHALKVRTRVESSIREFFLNQDFLETRTPLLVRSPGMETHIRPFTIESHFLGKSYLPTSPEFAMKKLLVGGLHKIFQICPAFRDEPLSVTHHPEFTMLEWYRAHSDYEAIMRDTEQLVESIALKLFNQPSIFYQGETIQVKTPWLRMTTRECFKHYCDIDLNQYPTFEALLSAAKESSNPSLKHLSFDHGWDAQDQKTWDDLYFYLWLNCIEPNLPKNQAIIIKDYPASQSALAVKATSTDGYRYAKRFEFYIGGIELGNAFEELTDPDEQLQRFKDDMKLRTQLYGDDFLPSPIDEDFIAALREGLPPSGGIAVGVDRLVMLFANEPDIQKTQWLPCSFQIADS